MSVVARFNAMKSVSFRNAALACAGSALLASLVTGLIVGSGSKQAAPRPPETQKQVATVATVMPSPPPPAPVPEPVAPPPTTAPEPEKVDKVTASEADTEKPKPKPVKVSSYKPPKVAEQPVEPTTGETEKLAPSPERDDPMRAVPDRVNDSSAAESATRQADPGF